MPALSRALFAIYQVSSALATVALIAIKAYEIRTVKASWRQHVLRLAYTAPALLLSTGTLIDNARLYYGDDPASFPAGVVGMNPPNATVANELIAQGVSCPQPMLAVTWASNFLHQSVGGTFALWMIFTWHALTPVPNQRPVRSVAFEASFRRVLLWGLTALTGVIVLVGTIGFFAIALPGGLTLAYDEGPAIWHYTTLEKSPVELAGVIYSSFLFIFLGAVLAYTHRVYWFVATQVVSLLLQAGAQATGSYAMLVSNFGEQFLVWTIVGLSVVDTKMRIQYQAHPKAQALLADDSEGDAPALLGGDP